MLVFAFLGQTYPWASHEYLLDKMDFRLFVDYYEYANKLAEMRYKKPEKKTKDITSLAK